MKRVLLLVLAGLLLAIPSALGGHTPAPASVTAVGSFQGEAGCAGDWDPGCAASGLTYDAGDDVWQRTFSLPAGGYAFKAALNGGWGENYGAGGAQNGPDVPFTAPGGPVKFYYDHETHWITNDAAATIVTAPGSFQSELGCSGDWDPSCLRSWLQDPDGDGVYTFVTTELPAGSYEAKAALRESWAENYGAGGVQNGPNIPFTVPADGAEVAFSYVAATHVLTIRSGHAPDGNVAWDGLRHDSRDTLYRSPGGAVPAGTPVHLRFRTFHDDVTAVTARVWSVEAGGQRLLPMERVAADVSCYDPALASETCDFWQVTLPNAEADNLWYRFVVSDGPDTDYYADDTPALDGGPGRTTEDPVDDSWALTVHEPGFATPAWARDAVVYQIFPDRFRNGDTRNDPKTGDVRYDDPVLRLPWGTLPEGYCRNYADAATSCPWRFDDTPPAWSPTKEGPRGRDYFGGDLKGVRQKLEYLQELGVTAIYFNPIFAAKSNHRYDTEDYHALDPALGDMKEWRLLLQQAREKGIRIVPDGVFNHMSSDSPLFDRYGHYSELGACESLASPWRSWFVFRNDNVPCGSADYVGWFGFDSIPEIRKTNPAVQEAFLTGPDAVVRTWIERGAHGWRFDVSGDPSFPDGYWETARSVVKGVDPDALLISETWGKDTTLLRMLRGDRLDTTMNYRLRDAVIGLLAPGPFDAKGFPDSGDGLRPSEFAARLASIREDYADQAYFTLMNLLDSHDTERLLWTLTPGVETRAAKEHDAANVAEGKRRLRLASVIQFTVPGMPTVYYGDEVGMTGDDDPDDRRTYPWTGPAGAARDLALLEHYKGLAALRRDVAAFTDGDLRVLLADDAAGTVAYGRRTAGQAALVVVNRGAARTVSVPVAGYLPDGAGLAIRYGGSGTVAVSGGAVAVPLGAMEAAVLVTEPGTDLEPPAAPDGLAVAGEGDGSVSLQWGGVDGAAGYAVYRSPVTGGGWVPAGTTAGTTFTDTGLRNGQTAYYVVRARDAAGNESGDSSEVAALPHLTIGWANLQWPLSIEHTLGTAPTEPVYGQVWIGGVTDRPGATPSLRAQAGFGPDGSDPAGGGWTWVEAAFNGDRGDNDEFVATLLPQEAGAYDYTYRYSTTSGRDWLYTDLDGPPYDAARAGSLTVNPSADTTPPAVPTGLRVVSASPAAIEVAWDAVGGDPTLAGYEVLRAPGSGGTYAVLALVSGTAYADTAVVEGSAYRYAVRAVDTGLNRSAPSAEVSAVAALRPVDATFTVTVPEGTPGTVYIAGTLSRVEGGLPDWNPGAVPLTQVDATRWTITLTGLEGTELEYKYTLGSWDLVEKDAFCQEINPQNRSLTLAYGTSGVHSVTDTVLNWRNVAPCGN